MNLATLSDQELKGFIKKMFQIYDKNANGTLEAPELALFFTDLYRSLGYHVKIDLPTALKAIRDISQTGTNSLTPYQVYCAFKMMSANTQAYFQQFTPISPFSVVKPPDYTGMDIEDCQEWAWPDK